MMDDFDLCSVGAEPGEINFIAWAPADARALIEARLLGHAKTDTSDGLLSGADVVGEGHPWIAFQRGEPLVLVVLRKVDYGPRGKELEICAAIALSDAPGITERVLPVIESAFGHDCRSIALHTRRAGLVRKLERAGYNEAAKIMRKIKR